MKRPFGLIGLVFLTVLAVAFYYFSVALVVTICAAGVLLASAALVVGIVRPASGFCRPALAVGAAAIAAVLSLLLYQNYYVSPIIDNYSDKEIKIQGYVSDDLHFSGHYVVFTVQTETIDGKDAAIKLQLTVSDDEDVQPFQRLTATLTPHPSEYSQMKSRRVFLSVFQSDVSEINAFDEYVSTPYSWAVWLRGRMKSTLSQLLPQDAAALSKAILLGDKYALGKDVKGSFADSGMSFLIVVSGFHLSVAAGMLRLILSRFRLNRFVSPAIISAFVLMFMAVTGFTPSVVRSGIMLITAYCGKAFFRHADSINSLGIAALILTLPNPYAVGDVGLLLSFSATFGIVLWSDKIAGFAIKRLGKYKTSDKEIISTRERALRLVKSVAVYLIKVFSVSLSAMLWVIPVTVFAFGRINPLTVFFSVIASPLAAAVIVSSMLLIAVSFVPFLNLVIASVTAFLCRALLFAVDVFNSVPFSHITADRDFYKVWVLVSLLLVALCYAFHAKGIYRAAAVVLSVLTLTTGGSLSYLFADRSCTLTVYPSRYGYTAVLAKCENVTLLSCGGSGDTFDAVADEIDSRSGHIDMIIIPKENKSHAAYLPDIINRFDVSDILVYDSTDEALPDGAIVFGDSAFEVCVNADASVRVVPDKNKVCFYVYTSDSSAVILPL